MSVSDCLSVIEQEVQPNWGNTCEFIRKSKHHHIRDSLPPTQLDQLSRTLKNTIKLSSTADKSWEWANNSENEELHPEDSVEQLANDSSSDLMFNLWRWYWDSCFPNRKEHGEGSQWNHQVLELIGEKVGIGRGTQNWEPETGTLKQKTVSVNHRFAAKFQGNR